MTEPETGNQGAENCSLRLGLRRPALASPIQCFVWANKTGAAHTANIGRISKREGRGTERAVSLWAGDYPVSIRCRSSHPVLCI